MIRKFYADGMMQTLADKRQVKVICSSENVDREGEVIVQSGIDLSNYRRNPVVLLNHNPSLPAARAVDIGLVNGRLEATIQFPPPGEILRSDETYAAIKNGILGAISIGFRALSSVPLDKGRPRGPQKYTACELLEISIVSVPANADALVSAKDAKSTGSTDAERLKRLHQVEVLRLAQPPEYRSARQQRLDEVAELRHIGECR